MAGADVADSLLFQVLALRLDPAWRRLSGAEREAGAAAFTRALTRGAPVRTIT